MNMNVNATTVSAQKAPESLRVAIVISTFRITTTATTTHGCSREIGSKNTG
jgi:hypothetical protein